MGHHEQPAGKPAKKNYQKPRRRFWIVLYFLGGLAAVVFVLWLISLCLNPAISDPIQFITGNLLNALIFAAIVTQAYIYHGQLRVMSVAFEPRLRITSVRAEGFEIGMGPAFIVSIINDGAMDAEAVELSIEVRLTKEATPVVKWSHPQTVTIPAHQEHHYPVPWRSPLTQELLDGFNNNVPLEITGYFKLGDNRTDFCYRYYPWQGKRPQGVSQFIPSDFSPAITHIVSPKGIEARATIGTVGVVISKSPEAEEKPKTEQNGEDNKGNPN